MNRTPIGRVTTALLPSGANPNRAPRKELPTFRSDSASDWYYSTGNWL